MKGSLEHLENVQNAVVDVLHVTVRGFHRSALDDMFALKTGSLMVMESFASHEDFAIGNDFNSTGAMVVSVWRQDDSCAQPGSAP